jgi:ATP adenylyltransferase
MDRIFATWRSQWVKKITDEADAECPFCLIVDNGDSKNKIESRLDGLAKSDEFPSKIQTTQYSDLEDPEPNNRDVDIPDADITFTGKSEKKESELASNDIKNFVVRREELVMCILNLYPYGAGHVLILPKRHVPDINDLDVEEKVNLWQTLETSIKVINKAFAPDGINFGANLGRSAGAGIPGHFHLHVLPRWAGDSGFITTIGDTRVISESLEQTRDKLAEVWQTLDL